MSGFQPSAPLSLGGHIDAILIHEPGGTPTNIIEAGTDFLVHVRWAIDGAAVALMSGTFNVKVFFEGFGTLPEKEYPTAALPTSPPLPIPVVPVSGTHYTVHVPVPGTVAAGGLEVGIYKMIAIVTYTNAAGNPGPIAGFTDEVVVQIFP